MSANVSLSPATKSLTAGERSAHLSEANPADAVGGGHEFGVVRVMAAASVGADAKFFGPDGPISYTKKNVGDSAIGTFFSRFTGVMFLALSAGYLFDKDSSTLAKQFGLGSAGFIPLMVMNSKDDVNYETKMWKLQHFIHIPLTIITLIKAFH